MDHKKNYNRLRNTLNIIETKGNNTLIMADCLKFLEQCIRGCEQTEMEKDEPTATEQVVFLM